MWSHFIIYRPPRSSSNDTAIRLLLQFDKGSNYKYSYEAVDTT